MRTHYYEQWTVGEFLDKVPEADNAFRLHNIDATAHMTFGNAAAAVSAPVDEVLAVMAHRLRRAARKAPVVKHEIQEIPIDVEETPLKEHKRAA
jgi:hypothetical protein